jgi:hypothetical protein
VVSLRARAGLLAVAAAIAVGLVAWLATTPSSRPEAGALVPPSGLALRAVIDPNPALFGDRVVATAAVLVDARRIDPASVRVATHLAPFTVVEREAPVVERTGDLALVRVRSILLCLSVACVSPGTATTLQLGGLEATGRERGGGGTATVAGTWPAVTLDTRLTAAELARRVPAFRSPARLPAPGYRIAPEPLARALTLAALALVALAFALVAWELRRLRPVVQARSRPLTLAEVLALVRRSVGRRRGEDRAALDVLARSLDEADEARLARAADALAWSRPDPTGAGVEALAGEVERTIEEGRAP